MTTRLADGNPDAEFGNDDGVKLANWIPSSFELDHQRQYSLTQAIHKHKQYINTSNT